MNTHFSRHTYLQVIRLSEVSRCPAGVYQAGCVVAAAAVVVCRRDSRADLTLISNLIDSQDFISPRGKLSTAQGRKRIMQNSREERDQIGERDQRGEKRETREERLERQ